jgi:pimeloyl-ACP methyl ester carboxylesterase
MEASEKIFTTRSNKTIAAKWWSYPAAHVPPQRVGICLHGWLDNASTFDLLAPLITTGTGNGGVDVLLCVDLAGHGRSGHNISGVYHPNEHVADVADVLFDLGWFVDDASTSTSTSPSVIVIGHSMGGGIGAVLCGTFPNRVHGLCMLEAVGPWSGNDAAAAKDLRKSILVSRTRRLGKNARPPRIFPDYESAAIRRSEGNVVGTLSLEAARILCRRGLQEMEVPMLSGDRNSRESPVSGYMWSTDPALLGPSRMKLSPSQARTFCNSLRCPTMVLTVDNGIMRRATSWMGKDTLWGIGTGFFLRVVLYMVTTIKWLRSWFYSSPNQTLSKIVYGLNYGLGLRERLSIMKSAAPMLLHAVMETGGHHPQLTEPSRVAYHILDFLQKSMRYSIK